MTAASPGPGDPPAPDPHQSGVLRIRPRRIQVICWLGAVTVMAVFSLTGVMLSGSTGAGQAVFRSGDRAAMIGLGVLGALAILLFTRPRVEADERGVRVRNLVGGFDLPWGVIRAVRFDRGTPWASLELHDDDRITMMAIQIIDKEYALDSVRALRALHARQSGGG